MTSALLRFAIGGELRFLSHAETLRFWHRACARASIPVRHVGRFNPRPKLSLPLPRSVGLASDDELLVLSLEEGFATESRAIRDSLAGQSCDGIRILDVLVQPDGKAPVPVAAELVFTVDKDCPASVVRAQVERIERADSIPIERRDYKTGKTRRLDANDYLESVTFDPPHIMVKCRITPAGTLRVDEMMNLLDLTIEKLVGPVRRTKVYWHRMHQETWNGMERKAN